MVSQTVGIASIEASIDPGAPGAASTVGEDVAELEKLQPRPSNKHATQALAVAVMCGTIARISLDRSGLSSDDLMMTGKPTLRRKLPDRDCSRFTHSVHGSTTDGELSHVRMVTWVQ